MSTFAQLGLNKQLLRNIEAQGYLEPTPVQKESMGYVLAGHDTFAVAPTGTGKTAAYLMPVLQELSRTSFSDVDVRPLRAVILVPTRELAAQVLKYIKSYSTELSLRSEAVFGGIRIESQRKRFKRGVDILVATPTRLLDLLKLEAFNLDKVETIIFDEADRIVGMGLTREVDQIIKLLPKQHQTLMFSATQNSALHKFSARLMPDPKRVNSHPSKSASVEVQHFLYRCEPQDKTTTLIEMIKLNKWRNMMVFVHAKHEANQLKYALVEAGINCDSLHSDRSQRSRIQNLDRFKQGEIDILICTDVAGRGIDIQGLPRVFNYDLPVNPTDYVHRIGRTARAGKKGEAISFVSLTQERLIPKIELAVKNSLKLLPNPHMKQALSRRRASSERQRKRYSKNNIVLNRSKPSSDK